MDRKQGINPVTIHPSRSDCKRSLTIGRLWVTRDANEPWIKNLVVSLYDPSNIEETIVMSVVDEENFVDALGHLFPNGELSRCHEEAPK